MRRVLLFEADLPDDQVEENGEILVYGGRSATQTLRDMMVNLGLRAGDIVQHSDNVWCFDVAANFGSFWVYVTSTEAEYLVTVERRGALKNMIDRRGNDLRQALNMLVSAVIELGGTSLRWFKTYDVNDQPCLTIDEVMRA